MFITCCDKEQRAKVLILPKLSYVWREFVYLEECEKCHSSRAVIYAMSYNGVLLTPNEWSGKTAKKKFEKYLLESRELIRRVATGTKSRMQWLYCNGNNVMYDFNNKSRLRYDDKLTITHIQA